MISRHSANRRWLCVLLVCGVGAALTLASDSDLDSDGAKARMTEMTSMIDGVRIDVDVDGKLQAAKREPKALLRTIDISRKNSGKEDGSLWLWSHDGMPVAMVELWAMNDSHNWGHTMLAVCQRELRGRAAPLTWIPRPQNGIRFKKVPKAGKPHGRPFGRKSQMRNIARRFKTNIEDPGQSNKQQFRLLTEPIHRYKGGDVEDGAIFAFVRGATNPEALLFNPVRVTEQMGSIEPSQVFFMLDASESMSIGNDNATRWDQAVNLIRDASQAAHEAAAAEISLFRFGRRLKAVESPDDLGLDDSLTDDGRGVTFVQKPKQEDDDAADSISPANEPDTQMFVALRQISSRFGRKPPAAVVVFSDGRARDAAQAEQVAATFAKLGVPVHTVPVGNTQSGGDVALVSLVVPTTARKQSEVQAQAFLRSYGFDGKQVQVRLNALDDAGRRTKRLATIAVTLRSGFQQVPINSVSTPKPKCWKRWCPISQTKFRPTTIVSRPRS